MPSPTIIKVRAWAVVLKRPLPEMGLPLISAKKPTHFDRRFCRRIRVEIREVRS
jgi:hypothetical protein